MRPQLPDAADALPRLSRSEEIAIWQNAHAGAARGSLSAMGRATAREGGPRQRQHSPGHPGRGIPRQVYVGPSAAHRFLAGVPWRFLEALPWPDPARGRRRLPPSRARPRRERLRDPPGRVPRHEPPRPASPPGRAGPHHGGTTANGSSMMTTNANGLEAHLQRALSAADRLFLALEEIEAAGGLAPALAGRRPGSRDEVLVRLRSAGPARRRAGAGRHATPRPARRVLLRRRANRPPPLRTS